MVYGARGELHQQSGKYQKIKGEKGEIPNVEEHENS